eukprot:SAG11_NODE_5444_length_1558_cov_1.759424_4_plen_84_part_01
MGNPKHAETGGASDGDTNWVRRAIEVATATAPREEIPPAWYHNDRELTDEYPAASNLVGASLPYDGGRHDHELWRLISTCDHEP